MSRRLHWSVPLAVLLGLVGLFVMSLSFGLGVVLVLIGLVVPVVVLWQSKRTAPATQEPRINKARKTAVPSGSPQHQVDRNKLGMLRYTLHRAGLDSNAPVFETRDHKVVTVRDILVEMIDIADAQGRPVEELAGDIVAIYPRIFENVDAALQQSADEASAKAYIARKAMADL